MLNNHKKVLFSNMKFDELAENFNDRPFFELKEVLSLYDDPPAQIKNQLSTWAGQDKLIHLRREKYLLAGPYRKLTPSVYYISNYLYRPSYVSLHTALQYHGMIPEAVAMIQAVTPRHGQRWETELGVFDYRSIKQDRFWGSEFVRLGDPNDVQNSFHMARPEKTLLDLFYLDKGEWTKPRLEEMRFQNLEKLDPETLETDASRFDSPKVSRAVERLLSLHSEEMIA